MNPREFLEQALASTRRLKAHLEGEAESLRKLRDALVAGDVGPEAALLALVNLSIESRARAIEDIADRIKSLRESVSE